MSRKKQFDPVTACAKAVAIRDKCIAHMAEIKADPEGIYDGMDPGDGKVTLAGNDWNVLTVLHLLDVIGIPGCKP